MIGESYVTASNDVQDSGNNITYDVIDKFLNGHDDTEHIVNIECGYNDSEVSIIYNKDDRKLVKKEPFYPFVWAKNSACIRLYNGDRQLIKKALTSFHIGVKKLKYKRDGETKASERMENGYKFIFYAKRPMSYTNFMMFFKMGKVPIYSKEDRDTSLKDKEYLSVSPVEQYMISTGKRLFKGYENYDDLKRLCFDLETQGLNPEVHAIEQIGIRTNKGFEKVISIDGDTDDEKKLNEYKAIVELLIILRDEKPDIIAGYNSENFDFSFIIKRLEVLGIKTMKELSSDLGYRFPIYKKKKETVLKLGGEVEYFYPTVIWGTTVIDALHAVRRAQALDSNIKSANLKYITKYSSLNKRNRVYVQGDKISETWHVTNKEYAFNDENGDWYHIDENHPIKEGYEYVSGRYIVERYLLDDIWETDKVELRYNESNFLVSKLLPTTFQRACTMGTAGIWKLIMMAWSYENDLAIPAFTTSKKFTGGLSRLLKVGYVDNIIKLDYNSLYPSILISWQIKNDLDLMDVMLIMLEYILTQREKYKGLKKKASKEKNKLKELLENFQGSEQERIKLEDNIHYYESEENKNDKKQLPLKILGNSYFGSLGSSVFPWANFTCAEKTTSIGRQSLRTMIKWFSDLGYTPIVGDSVSGDTPLFIKYDESGYIDIKPISELIDEESVEIDMFKREYDLSRKNYKVLCRSGWIRPTYVYRHKTDKDIYEVNDNTNYINVTEDHSLFKENQEKIKPSEINENTKLEYNKHKVEGANESFCRYGEFMFFAKMCANGSLDRVPCRVLNSEAKGMEVFLDEYYSYIRRHDIVDKDRTKTFKAGLNYLINKINYFGN